MIDHPPIAGALLAQIMDCEKRNHDLLVATDAERLIARFVEEAKSRGCVSVVGASDTGKMIVGAMLVASQGNLRPWRPGMDGAVMVVDGVTSSPLSLEQAARFAARWVAEVHKVAVSCPNGESVHVLEPYSTELEIATARLA